MSGAAQAISSPSSEQLEQAMSSLMVLGNDLVESYAALERRASRVENELVLKLAELDQVTRHLEGVLAAIPTGVVVRDGSGRVVRTNPAADELLRRLGPAELEGGSPRSVAAWEQRDLRDHAGLRLVLARRCSPLDRNSQLGSVELWDDRTALVELQERLHSLDKIAALGNVAGGVAHEIKNPMNAVKGFSAMLAKRLPQGSDEQRWASLIGDASCRVEEVMASMLTLAAPERLCMETIQPRELAQAAADLAAQELGDESRRWRIEVEGDGPPIAGDRIKLRQALRNLIANAAQAQPDGGVVTVAIEARGGELVFEVADGGAGIPPELRLRVLEPFFTTRAEGTGLGLALVSEIARLHGGCVEVSPRPSRHAGASLFVRLPINRPS